MDTVKASFKPRVTRIYGDKYIVIEFDEDERWIYADWIGEQNEAAIRRGGMQMISAMKKMAKLGCHRVLNDNRRVTGIWGHSADWAAQEWLPAMIAAGLQHFAWILSPSAITNLSGVRMRSRSLEQSSKTMRVFEDITEAKAWLRSFA